MSIEQPKPDTTASALQAIGEQLRTQDNRITRDPMFCVQVLDRIGPLLPEHCDTRMYHNHEECEIYYKDYPDPEEWKRLKALDDACELPDEVTAGGYEEMWKTVQVCFTEDGCKQHLELNGHNYRHYYGVRIYAECFFRNPEMIAIRDALMANQLTAES